MLINVYRERPAAIPGTRVLGRELGIEGYQFEDPFDAKRVWQIDRVYLPAAGRVIGGVRTKMRDQKGFITFCNQRDLEVMLGYAQPGELCSWLDTAYVGPTDDDWLGMMCDEEDLRDDLYDRECFLRTQLNEEYMRGENPGFCGVITTDNQLARRVHMERHCDVEDLFVLIGDYSFETGQAPDTNFDSVERRWMRAERRRVRWEKS